MVRTEGGERRPIGTAEAPSGDQGRVMRHCQICGHPHDAGQTVCVGVASPTQTMLNDKVVTAEARHMLFGDMNGLLFMGSSNVPILSLDLPYALLKTSE